MNTLVSVLMSIYKEPIEWVSASIESILKQSFSNLQIILISDNPTNSTLTQYLKSVEKRDERVTVVFNEKNIGLVKSLNKGLKLCQGKYIARMDADDISFPSRIEKQLEYIEQTKYDLIGCQYYIFEDDKIIGEGIAPTSYESCKKIVRYKSCIAHPTWFVKSNVFKKLYGYRDIDTCEDLDFLQRAMANKFKLGNAPYVLFKYRNNPNSISHQKELRQQAIRRFMARCLYKNVIMSEDNYLKYVSGIQYQKDIKAFEDIAKLEEKFKNDENTFHKISTLLALLKEPIFIEEKIWNYKINIAIKKDKKRMK